MPRKTTGTTTRTTRKRNTKAMSINRDPERFKNDPLTKEAHKTYTPKEVETMVENGETSYTETTYVDGIHQYDIDYLREASSEETAKTPSEYFKYLKELVKGIDNESINAAIVAVQDVIRTCVVTGQKALANGLVTKLELMIRERNAVEHGYTQILNRVDFEAWAFDIADKANKSGDPNPIHLIELRNYTRTIPDDVLDKVGEARNYFDMLYVAYTDYTGETVRKVEKAKRDKDPIVFGAFLVPSANGNKMASEHLFFIADWVDDFCDLTMDQVIKSYKKATKEDILLPVERFTTTDLEEIKKQIKEMK